MYYESNLNNFNYIKGLLSDDISTIELPNELIKCPLINEPTYDHNRVFYISIDIFDFDLIKEIHEKMTSKSILILWYSKLEYMKTMLTMHDFQDMSNDIIFLGGSLNNKSHLSIISNTLRDYTYNMTKLQPIIKSVNDIEYIRTCKEVLVYIREFRTNFVFMLGNDLNDTLVGLRNRCINFVKFTQSPGLNDFLDKYLENTKNTPAVIVSTGPSLDSNIQELVKYQDQAIIFSADCSLSTLANHNIVADFVGSVERGLRTFDAFYENKKLPQGTSFIGPAVVRPELIDSLDKPFLAVYKDKDTYGKWLNGLEEKEKGVIWCGTSVSHMLLQAAHKMGCDPIILIGQDLAYTKDGVSHASEAEVIEHVDINEVSEWVEDINGELLPTTVLWKNFLNIFETMIREDKMNVIDATEGGAKIEGTTIMTFKEALEQNVKGRKLNCTDAISKLTVEREDTIASLNRGCSKIHQLIELHALLEEKIDHALETNEASRKIIEKGLDTQEELDSIYDSLEYVENEIVKKVVKDEFLMMLFQYPIFKIAGLINSLDSDKFSLDTIEINLNLHASLLNLMKKYTRKAIRTFIDALSSFESGLAGESFDQLDLSKFEDIINDIDTEITLIY